MIWPFKAQIDDEEYVSLFRRLWATHQEMRTAEILAVAGGLTYEDVVRFRSQVGESENVIPRHRPWRPVHRVLAKLLRVQLLGILDSVKSAAKSWAAYSEIRHAIETQSVASARHFRQLLTASQERERHQRWMSEIMDELERRMAQLPESDPIRSGAR